MNSAAKVAKLADIFKKNLRRALTAKHGLRSEVARRAGMAPNQIYRYLSGESTPSLDVLERLADALGVPASELLTDHSDDATIERFSREWNSLRLRAQKIPEVKEVFEKIDGLLKLFLDETKPR